MKLIATKSLVYATRRLMPGDPFDATDGQGRLLIAIKKARDASKRDRVELAPPSPELAARLVATPPVVAASPLPENRGRPAPPSASEVSAPVAVPVADTPAVEAGVGPDAAVEPAGADLEALRAEATQLGVVVDGRWGAQRLSEAIEAARKP